MNFIKHNKYQAKHRYLFLLMLLAFVSNTVLPYYLVSSPFLLSFDLQDEQRSSDTILICTATGYQWVSLSEPSSDANGEQIGNMHSSHECVLCYFNQDDSNNLVLVAFTEFHLYSMRQHSVYKPPVFFIKQSSFLNSGRTRAPPIFYA